MNFAPESGALCERRQSRKKNWPTAWPRIWFGCRFNRRANSAVRRIREGSGFLSARRFHHNDAGGLSRIDPLSCLAINPWKYVLQVLDHCCFCNCRHIHPPLGPLRGWLGSSMLGLIWAVAIFVFAIKITRGTERHRKLAMSLYLGMGWSALLVAGPLISLLTAPAMIWLVAGGIAYTVGVLFYVQERLRYAHLVWHLLVLTGTSCHFLALLSCTA